MTDKWATAVITSKDSGSPPDNTYGFTVLHILPKGENTEVRKDVIEISDKLAKEGCASLVIAEDSRKIKSNDLPFISVSLSHNPLKTGRNVKLLQQIIKDKQIDIIHIYEPFSFLTVNLLRCIPKTKIVSSVYKAKPVFPFKFSPVLAKVLKDTDIAVAATAFVAEKVQEQYRFPESKMRVVYGGIDLDSFSLDSVSEENKSLLKSSLNIPADDKIILAPLKNGETLSGQDVLLESLNQLQDVSYTLIFIGDFNDKNKGLQNLEAELKDGTLKDKIRFIKNYDNFKEIYALADVVVFASEKYIQNEKSVIKTQAMGQIAIAADFGGNSEVLKNGLTGFLFEKGNAESLADCIKKVFAMTAKEREVMSMTARNCAYSDFSNGAMCAKIFKIYCELL